jgi:molybdopterin molybdotransferase
MKRDVTAEELVRGVTPYGDAVARFVASFSALPPVEAALDDAVGCVAAEDVRSEIDVPGFPSSAMDGYAVRSADARSGARLRITSERAAGHPGDGATLQPGEAIKIMTGAPVPDGADAIVPWEDTVLHDDEIEITRGTSPNRHVRPLGEDVERGRVVIEQGEIVTAIGAGVAASIGRTTLLVHPRARVAIASTGDEVVPPGETLPPGAIYDANRTVLRALCAAWGATIVRADLIADDPEALRAWLHDASENADLIVTTGGASVGEHDWMRALLERDGELQWWRVAVKPGKPIAFARLGSAGVLALPGNPGSAVVGAHIFVARAIRLLSGRAPDHVSGTATLGAEVKGSPSRTAFTRVRLEGGTAIPLPAQSSVVLSNLLAADAFALVPPGGLPAGAPVTWERLTT